MKKINRIKFILIEAFTLAEIMIVLSVIGVLTAILLPSARQMTPDEIEKTEKRIMDLVNHIIEKGQDERYVYQFLEQDKDRTA